MGIWPILPSSALVITNPLVSIQIRWKEYARYLDWVAWKHECTGENLSIWSTIHTQIYARRSAWRACDVNSKLFTTKFADWESHSTSTGFSSVITTTTLSMDTDAASLGESRKNTTKPHHHRTSTNTHPNGNPVQNLAISRLYSTR